MNVGDTVGSYRIVGTLGEGGMGSVFLAEHSLIGRYAAIKVLHPQLSDKQDQVNRFFNEARATSAIKHPSILEIYDFGWNNDGRAYIVMEYLEGESLETRVNRLGRLSTEHALHVTRQVAGALAAAHAQGVVHRDLKPDNIYIVRDPEVAGGERIKILDFGIAKVLSDTSSTKSGALIGTPDYMAPEQCRGAAFVDHRSDFYSLGCILFRLLCGRPPFVGEGVGEVLAAHLHLAVPRPSAIDPSIEPLLEGFILRLLSKDPAERFSSASELITELDAVWVGTFPGAMAAGTTSGVDHRPLGKTKSHSGSGPSTISSAAMELPAPRGSGHGSLRVVAISSVMVLVVGGVGFAIFGQDLMGRGEDGGPRAKVSAAPTPTEVEEPEILGDGVEPSPEQVVISIRSEPEGADVFRASDGLRVGKTPYRYALDPVDGEFVFIVKMEGYEPHTLSFPANQSASEEIELKKIGGHSSSSSSKSRDGDESDPFDMVLSGDKKSKEADELLHKIRSEAQTNSKKQHRSSKSADKKSNHDSKPPAKVENDKVFDPFQ